MSDTRAALDAILPHRDSGDAPGSTWRDYKEEYWARGHARIDNCVFDLYGPHLGAHGVAVLALLSRYADARTRQCYPSTRRIAKTLAISRPTVLNAIRVLERLGLISVERRRTKGGKPKVNVYTLLPVPVGQAPLPSLVNDVDHQGKPALPEQDLINKTQENKRERAPAPCAPAPCALARRPSTPALPTHEHARDPNLDHPAVVAYRERCKVTPNETQRAEIAAVVTDLPRWQEVMRRWLLKDYRKTNVEGMLDWYRNGIPERGGGNGGNGAGRRPGYPGNRLYDRPESRPAETPDERARRDAEFNALKQSHNRRQHDEVSCS